LLQQGTKGMRRKTVVVLLAISLLLAVFTGLGGADSYSYYITDQYTSTSVQDAKKSGGDNNMCWAAAASDILAWGSWGASRGTSTYKDVTQIFNYFKLSWANDAGDVDAGWRWWFNGTNRNSGVSGKAQLTGSGSGDFYPALTFSNYFKRLLPLLQ
jgi:hypothetical protein